MSVMTVMSVIWGKSVRGGGGMPRALSGRPVGPGGGMPLSSFGHPTVISRMPPKEPKSSSLGAGEADAALTFFFLFLTTI